MTPLADDSQVITRPGRYEFPARLVLEVEAVAKRLQQEGHAVRWNEVWEAGRTTLARVEVTHYQTCRRCPAKEA